jgi:hypothetical protein
MGAVCGSNHGHSAGALSLPRAAEIVIRNLGAGGDSIVTMEPDAVRDERIHEGGSVSLGGQNRPRMCELRPATEGVGYVETNFQRCCAAIPSPVPGTRQGTDRATYVAPLAASNSTPASGRT